MGLKAPRLKFLLGWGDGEINHSVLSKQGCLLKAFPCCESLGVDVSFVNLRGFKMASQSRSRLKRSLGSCPSSRVKSLLGWVVLR